MKRVSADVVAHFDWFILVRTVCSERHDTPVELTTPVTDCKQPSDMADNVNVEGIVTVDPVTVSWSTPAIAKFKLPTPPRYIPVFVSVVNEYAGVILLPSDVLKPPTP